MCRIAGAVAYGLLLAFCPIVIGSGVVVVVVVVVRNKVRQSYISRTVLPRITKFYTHLHTHRVYNHTGHDVTRYFQSEVMDVRKTADNGSERLSDRMAAAKIGIFLKVARLR